MVIQHNISALNAHRNMGLNNGGVSKNLEKLSSGYKINRAGDDAAGLAISEKMRGQIRGLAMAEQNASNGVSLIQTAEGGLNESHAILQRMRELAVQSSNGTYKDEDRDQITKEFEALKSEVDRIADSTHYNGIKLLDGSLNGTSTKGAAALAAASSVTGLTITATNAADIDIAGKIEMKQEYDADGKVKEGSFTVNYEFTKTDGSVVKGSVSGVTKASTAGDSNLGIAAGADAGERTFTLTDNKGGAIKLNNLELKEGSVSFKTKETIATAGDGITVTDQSVSFINGKSAGLVFQIGANGGTDQRVGLRVADMSAEAIGLKQIADDGSNNKWEKDGLALDKDYMLKDASIDTIDKANMAIEIISAATNMVSGQRAELGALQNRLEHTLNNLGVTKENLTAAESSIRDVDMAKEMMEFTKNNILIQASQSMLAQANQLPQGVLQLLR